MKERIQKVLGNAGVASRRSIEQMVLDGRVTVNGKIIQALPVLIDPEKDKVSVDGEAIRLARGGRTGGGAKGAAPGARGAHEAPVGRRFYFLLNKPKGVYSSASNNNPNEARQTKATDFLPPGLPGRLYPVGELDADSKGLLLLTNDGDLTNRMTHPRYGIAKVYRAIVDGSITPEALKELQEGVWLADPYTGEAFKTAATQVSVVKRLRERSVLDITIHEGKNRQIRRLLAKLGHKARELTRTKMGPLTLVGLKPGQFRELSPREVRRLREVTEKPAGKAPAKHGRGIQDRAATPAVELETDDDDD
ncbi:MAG TPA: pseudouridine synthase [Tepidisphaeraceae bacterium]|nr:pseudouridine synthase [Tepidisphaeraceae bacterium]